MLAIVDKYMYEDDAHYSNCSSGLRFSLPMDYSINETSSVSGLYEKYKVYSHLLLLWVPQAQLHFFQYKQKMIPPLPKPQLDESTARRQLKSPRSLSGRSIHLTLVTKWSWSWSWMTYCHPLCAMSISPPILRYRYFKIWPWKSMVKVMCVVKGSKVKVMVKVKPDGHIWGLGVQSICLLFVSWQSDHFWLRYSKFYIWPWKLKVKVMEKFKPDDHIWALESHRYVCFSFRGNRTIFGWDIANSIFDLVKSMSRSWPRSNPMVTFEP